MSAPSPTPRRGGVLARISPPLAVAFVSAVLAIGLLHWRHVNARERVRIVSTTNERMQEARLRVARAYLVQRQVRAGDASFAPDEAAAQLDLAARAVDAWLTTGRPPRPLIGSARPDPELRRLVVEYARSIASFRATLLAPGSSDVEHRAAFAALERQADAVGYRLRLRRAESARREERDHAFTVFLLTFFILVTGAVLHRLGRRRDEARGALAEADARLRVLVNQLPVVSWTTDEDLRVRSAFGALLTAVPGVRPDIVGHRLHEIVTADPERVHRTHRDALAGRHARYDVAIEDRHMTVAIEPLRDHAGRITGVVGVMLDITERHRLEMQLHTAQKMEAIGRLAAGVAHDFNNLLTVIRTYAQLLAETLDDTDPRRAEALEIEAAGERGSRLVRQLLAVGREQPQQRRDLDLVPLIDEMAPMLRQLCGERVTVRVETDLAEAWVAADLSQLEQIVLNLVVNARDAMPDGGTVTIGLRQADAAERAIHGTLAEDAYVELRVTDTGHGMDEATQAQIFDPFFTTKSDGHGLGLATVYGIIQQSGGAIRVESAPGRGTSFVILLPFGRAAGARRERESARA